MSRRLAATLRPSGSTRSSTPPTARCVGALGCVEQSLRPRVPNSKSPAPRSARAQRATPSSRPASRSRRSGSCTPSDRSGTGVTTGSPRNSHRAIGDPWNWPDPRGRPRSRFPPSRPASSGIHSGRGRDRDRDHARARRRVRDRATHRIRRGNPGRVPRDSLAYPIAVSPGVQRPTQSVGSRGDR